MTATPPNDAEAGFAAARAQHDAGNHAAAVRALERLVQQHEEPGLLAQLSAWAADDGDLVAARNWLTRLRAVAPGSPNVPRLLSRLGLEVADRPPHLTPTPGGATEAVAIAKPERGGEVRDQQLQGVQYVKIRVRDVVDGYLGSEQHLELRGVRLLGSVPQQGHWIAYRDSDAYLERGVRLYRRIDNLSTNATLAVDDDVTPGMSWNLLSWWKRLVLPLQILGRGFLGLLSVVILVAVLAGLAWVGWDKLWMPRQPVPLPNVAGMEEMQARSELDQHRFGNVGERVVQTEDVPTGQVAGTEPAAGTVLAPMERVVLLIADPAGPPGSTVVVPDVVGLTRDEAFAKLMNRNINVVEKGSIDGTVVRVRPKPGSKVQPTRPGTYGDPVTMGVSDGLCKWSSLTEGVSL